MRHGALEAVKRQRTHSLSSTPAEFNGPCCSHLDGMLERR
jgi:hypothetical protein